MTFDDDQQFADELDEPQVEYDPVTQQWFWIAGALAGTVVVNATIIAEIEVHTAAISPLFQAITGQMYAGEITVAQWQTAVAVELQEGFTAMSAFGAGGVNNLAPEALARITVQLENQFGHLDDFASGIIDGTISERQALARIRQYSNTIEQAYWSEWQQGLDRPEWADLQRLPRIPVDGTTICRGNCQCFLEFTDNGIFWVLTPADHCATCLEMADGSPWRPM